jgi:recombination protein RecT
MSSNILIQKPGDLMRYLEKSKSAIAMALPKHLTPERMMRLALTCFSTNPQLRNCTPQSILSSVVVASQLGLEPGIAGQGYLIPYKETCTFVPGWQGLVGLLNNSGRATAWTGAVFEGDLFEFQLGSEPRCHHVPGEHFGDPDKLIWVYACGKVNGSEQPVIEAWPMKRVWRHRDQFNKVGKRHYSYENPEMYARKVVLLQVLKYMPRSIELNNAMAASEAAELGKATTITDGVVVEVESSVAGSPGEESQPIDPFVKANTAPQGEAPAEQAAPAKEEPESLL